MFQGLINDVRHAANAMLVKYLGRAIVAVPFIVALAFGTAALALVLVDRYGAKQGLALIALGYTVIGVLAAIIVSVKEHEVEAEPLIAAPVESEAQETAEQALAPVAAMLLPLVSSPVGASAALGVVRWAVRNIPLLVFLGIIGVLAWPGVPNAGTKTPDAGGAMPAE